MILFFVSCIFISDAELKERISSGDTELLEGSFEMDLQGSLTGTDHCTGTISLTYRNNAVDGTFNCAFSGTLPLFQDQFGSISGGEDGGALQFQSDLDTEIPWTGAYTDNGIAGSFGETVSGTLEQYEVAGSFFAEE
jgi:hypothetical protein